MHQVGYLQILRSLYLQVLLKLPDLLHKRVFRRGQAFWTLQSTLCSLHTTMFQIKYFDILPTEYIYEICMNLKSTLIIFMTGFYNWKRVCLLRGTSWVYKLRVIKNECRGFNNLSFTINLRQEYMYFFLFNRTTLQVFVTYLTGALYVHPLWFYK